MDSAAPQNPPDNLRQPAPDRPAQAADLATARLRAYDFRSSGEMPPEGVFQVRGYCQKFCKVLGPIAGAYLDSAATAEMEALESARLDQCMHGLPEFAATGLIEVAEHLSEIIWHIDAALTRVIIGRMLGGRPVKLERAPTSLETALLRRFIQEMMDVWAATWEGLARWQPRVTEVIADVAQLQTRVRDEQVLWLLIRTAIEDERGTMGIFLPVSTVQRLLGGEEGRAHARSSAASALTLTGAASQVTVPVSIVVHQGTIRLREVMRLREGEVIPLRKPVDTPLTVAVHGRPKFLAHAGVRQGHLAARLLAPTDDFAT